MVKNKDINIAIGEFKPIIRKERFDLIMSEHGLGKSNERGDRFLQIFQENSLVIIILQLEVSSISPDFNLINDRFHNAIKSDITYPGVDIGFHLHKMVKEMTHIY